MKIGIIQQSCTADTAENKKKLARNIADVASRGAQLVVLQELHNSLYFCQTEDVTMCDLAEPIPGPSTAYYSDLARRHGIVLVTSLFERRAAGLYHNTAAMILPTTRSSTSPPAIWVSTPYRHRWAASGFRFAGTSGTQRGRG